MPSRERIQREREVRELSANRELIKELLNIIVSSSQIEQIVFPSGESYRGNLHCLIYGDIGVGKSSDLKKITEFLGVTVQHGLTRSHLLGSVDKATGNFCTPIIWDYRRSIVAIDDFYYDYKGYGAKDTIQSLLSLMEFPRFQKSVGYRCNDIEKKDGNLWMSIKNNKINIKTSFSFIATTMMNPFAVKSMEIEALISRCLVLPYRPTKNEIFRKLEGKSNFKPKIKKIKNPVIKINRNLFMRIQKFVKDQDLENKYILRTVGDICRIHSVTKKWDEELFKFVIRLNKVYG